MGWDSGQEGTEATEPRSLVDGAERAVREWVVSGRFRPGDRLPPEQELAGMLGISRGTLRSALRRLEQSSEIVRRQGSGTFVGRIGRASGARRALRASAYNLHFLADLPRRDVRIELRPVDAAASEALGIAVGLATTMLTRRILDEERRVAYLAHDVIHPDVLLPDLETLRARLLEDDMFDVLWSTETPPAVARTRITPILLSPEDPLGESFELTEPVACLRIEELLLGGHDQPLLYSWDVARPGMVELEVLRSTGTAGLEPLPGRDGHEVPVSGD